MTETVITFDVNPGVPTQSVTLPDYMVTYDLADLVEGPPNLKAVINRGSNNQLIVGPNAKLSQLGIKVTGSNNRIILGSDTAMRGFIEIADSDRVVFIGAYSGSNQVKIICKHGGNVYIGRNCMFSANIEIRTSDAHAIIDLNTRKVTNPGAGVYIGDHVWVGKDVVVTKGAVVADDTIIGMGSFVRGTFRDTSTVIAGAPAKVVSRDRTWAHNMHVDPQTEDIFAWRSHPLL